MQGTVVLPVCPMITSDASRHDLQASTSLIFGLHRHLCEYFQELCSDPDPDMARHLRTHLNCTVQRLMAPAIFLVLANVAFLVMVVSGAFSFLVPSVEGYTRFMQRTFLYPFPDESAWAATLWILPDIFPSASWILGTGLCYLSMSLPLERMKRLEAGLRDGSLPVAELRAAHTRACETIEKVDELYQHFSTAWLIIGWWVRGRHVPCS
jgi:hypothetical protein